MLITTREAARLLGLSRSRVLVLLRDPCPICHGQGETCSRCHQTGRRLPGQLVQKLNRPAYQIEADDLELVQVRKVGWPKGRKRKPVVIE